MKQQKNLLRHQLKDVHLQRVKQYIQQKDVVQTYLLEHPGTIEKERIENERLIKIVVENLKDVHESLKTYVLRVKDHTADVLDQTRFGASYLLFCHVMQTWQAVFLLARNGFHYEVMELLRSISESHDLIFLFMSKGEEGGYLQRWFAGEVIKNAVAREAMHGYVNNRQKIVQGEEIPTAHMMSGVYEGLSKYTHTSYMALLDSFDVYNHDYDHGRVASTNYLVTSSLPYAGGTMKATIIAFKHFFQEVDDENTFQELDEILRSIAPEMGDEEMVKKKISSIKGQYGSC